MNSIKVHSFLGGSDLPQLRKFLVTVLAAATVAIATPKVAAQPGAGGGMAGGAAGFTMPDAKQMAQMQVTALRDTLGVTNDTEWNAIASLVTKVVVIQTDVQMAEMARRMGPMMANLGGAGGANPFGTVSDPTGDALQKSLDNNASAAEIKAALARYRDARKQKQAELAKARDALKQVLTTRQEATLTMSGILE